MAAVLSLTRCRFDYGTGLDYPRLETDGRLRRGQQEWDVDTTGLPTDVDTELIVESGGRFMGRFLLTAAPIRTRPASSVWWQSHCPSRSGLRCGPDGWNAIAVATLSADTSKKPQEGFLYLGFVQAAIYDAVVGVKGRYEPYRFDHRAPRGTSGTAAAAAAGHKILETYSPYAQAALDAALATSLAGIPDGAAKTNGVAFGEQAAQNLINLRANDGRNAPVLFTKPAAPGVWRPTPPALAPMAVPWLGGTTPLLVHSATQFAPPAPPTLTSKRYTRDFAEVKAVGSATSTNRTADQTSTALFFSGNAAVQFNATLRDQAATRGLDIVDAARMFAAVDMTVSDAVMTVWRAKLFYGIWRPSTAIQLAGTDGNPATIADPGWTPLIPDPPYPDYVSGYNSVAASASRVLEGLFGRGHLNLTLISTAVPGAVRQRTGSPCRCCRCTSVAWDPLPLRRCCRPEPQRTPCGLDPRSLLPTGQGPQLMCA